MAIANKKEWAVKGSPSGSTVCFTGHACKECGSLHKDFLFFWSWPKACNIYQTAEGHSKSALDHARAGRAIALPKENIAQVSGEGMRNRCVVRVK